MDPYILCGADSGGVGQERERAKCILRRISNGQAHVSRKEDLFNPQSVEVILLDCIARPQNVCKCSNFREQWGRAVCSRRTRRTHSLVKLHQEIQLHHGGEIC
jgi:hypothetical protein